MSAARCRRDFNRVVRVVLIWKFGDRKGREPTDHRGSSTNVLDIQSFLGSSALFIWPLFGHLT